MEVFGLKDNFHVPALGFEGQVLGLILGVEPKSSLPSVVNSVCLLMWFMLCR